MLAVALVDWLTKPFVSLGFLYLFPIMLGAAFLPRWAIVALGILCAVLAETFSSLDTSRTRLLLEALALTGCGLFVSELTRNRRLSLQSQERLRALVETSPAAIVTVDENGYIELANQAASQLIEPRGEILRMPIAAFFPELHHALRWEDAPQFRTSMQCTGHRGNGETFTAEIWFSTYREGEHPKLAAIIAATVEENDDEPVFLQSDIDELTSREQEVLRLLVQGFTNKEIGARIHLSESGVKNTMQQLFKRSGVRTRSQLVRIALERYRSIL